MKVEIVKIWGRNKKKAKYGVIVPTKNRWGFSIHTPQYVYPGGFIWSETNWEKNLCWSYPEKVCAGYTTDSYGFRDRNRRSCYMVKIQK